MSEGISGASPEGDRAAGLTVSAANASSQSSIPSAEPNHAETAPSDTPKERALRLDYELADAEVQCLKAELKRVRMIPLSEEAEAMFYWRDRCKAAEEVMDGLGLNPRERFERLAQGIEARRAETGTGSVHESPVLKGCAHE